MFLDALRRLFNIFSPINNLIVRKGTNSSKQYIQHPEFFSRSLSLIKSSEDGIRVYHTVVEPQFRYFVTLTKAKEPHKCEALACQIAQFATKLWEHEAKENKITGVIDDTKMFAHEAVLSILAEQLPSESEESTWLFIHSPSRRRFEPGIKLLCFLGKCSWEYENIQYIANHTNKSQFLVGYILTLKEYFRPSEQGRKYRDVVTKLADDPAVRKFLLEVGVSDKIASQHSVVAVEVFVPLLQYSDSHTTLLPILKKCPATLPSLVEKLNEKDSKIYIQLLREIGNDAIPHLLMALKKPLFRIKAAQLLIEFGTSAVKPSIDFAEQNPEQRPIVAEILSAIGGEAFHAVITLMERANSYRRSALSQLLVLDEAIVPTLELALADSKLQIGALFCLSQIQDNRADAAILNFYRRDATEGSFIAQLVVAREGSLLSQFCSAGGLIDLESACSDSEVLKQFLYRCSLDPKFCKDYDEFVWQQSILYLSLSSEKQMEGEQEEEIQTWLGQRIQQANNPAHIQSIVELYGSAPTLFLEDAMMQLGTRSMPYLRRLLSSESTAQHGQRIFQKLEITHGEKKAYLESLLNDANTEISKNAFSMLVTMKLGDIAIFQQVLGLAKDNQQRILAIKGIESLKQCKGELLETLIAIAIDSGNDHLSIAAAKCVIASKQKAPHHTKEIERKLKVLFPRSERTRYLRELRRSLR